MFYLHKFYRYIFDTFFKWSDVTFIGWINRKLEIQFGKDRKQFDNINLELVKRYFDNNIVNNGNIQKTILVEAIHTQAKSTLHINFMQLLISSTFRSRVVGYTNFYEPDNEKIFKSFGVNEFINIYKFFNFKVVFLALLTTFKSCILGGKFTKFKNLEVIVDGINIGDNIYDNFLRRELVATHRKKTLKYCLYVYRGCYFYYSSKTALSKLNITDIIVNSKVYTNGILIKACTSISKDVNIWKTEPWSYTRFSISRTNTSKCGNEIPFDRLFKDPYLKLILEKFSVSRIESLFDESFNEGLSWVEDEPDNVISDVKEFDAYPYDKKKKNIVLLSHAFNDAVRIANNNIFADYYIWLSETLALLSSNNNINIFVKPHPYEGRYHYKEKANSVVKNVLINNPSIKIFFIDKDIKQDCLFDFADTILTVCGTVGLEAPCFGVPVVTAARGSYYEANTTINSENFSEYKDILANVHLIDKMSRDQIFKAKAVYVFTNLIRHVDFDFDFDKNSKDDIERFDLINTYFGNLPEVKSLHLYEVYSDMLRNNRDEFINI